MQETIKSIQMGIINLCEFHWQKQVVMIEDIIKKLERDDKNKLMCKVILSKAEKIREDSENYSNSMQQALSKYSTQIY